MKYDNQRDRHLYGYDAGTIVDGDITLDIETGEYVIVDEDGVAFSAQELFKSLVGKRIRFTCISFESIEAIQNMLSTSHGVDSN